MGNNLEKEEINEEEREKKRKDERKALTLTGLLMEGLIPPWKPDSFRLLGRKGPVYLPRRPARLLIGPSARWRSVGRNRRFRCDILQKLVQIRTRQQLTLQHHRTDLPRVPDVIQRIRGEQDEIGRLALFHRPVVWQFT